MLPRFIGTAWIWK